LLALRAAHHYGKSFCEAAAASGHDQAAAGAASRDLSGQQLGCGAAHGGRRFRLFGVNAFIIARDSEDEAHQVLHDIVRHADREAVDAFGHAVKQAGAASPEAKGMWADSTFEDLVHYNDGFKTGRIGTPEPIARKIVALKSIGVDLVPGGFLHFIEEVEYFGKRVLPLVRELEREQRVETV
jgi:FMNH2-dependent dimethyl sulfone monooxygenase